MQYKTQKYRYLNQMFITVSRFLNRLPKIFILAIIFPLVILIKSLLAGNIAFWNDPARDLLLALDNIQKPTLIGSPSGIPGVFYGPYWIWLLSIPLLISKNPQFVALTVLTIPYFTIFPIILYKFNKIFNSSIVTLLWLLFILRYDNYTTNLWHPYLVPILLLVLIYFVVFSDQIIHIKNFIRWTFWGILSGLIFNSSMSFGVPFILGCYAFFFIDAFTSISFKKTKWTNDIIKFVLIILFFSVGFLLTLLPFLVFEIKHGFHQMGLIVHAVTNALFYNSPVVGQVGFSPLLILEYFFGRVADLLVIPSKVSIFLYITIAILVIRALRRGHLNFTYYEGRMLLLLLTISTVVLSIFLTSKNPVWDYYFVGVEIIFLLFIGLIIKKIQFLQILLIIWVVILIALEIFSFLKSYRIDPYTVSSFASKKYIIDLIIKDNHGIQSAVFVYSPSISTYDYDYLFKVFAGSENIRIEKNVPSSFEYTYLVIPTSSKAVREDFINYVTPHGPYKTLKQWKTKDGTYILKRLKQPITNL